MPFCPVSKHVDAIVVVVHTLFVILGDRAVTLMKQAEGEVARRQPDVTIYALLLLAAVFAIDAAVVLVTQIR